MYILIIFVNSYVCAYYKIIFSYKLNLFEASYSIITDTLVLTCFMVPNDAISYPTSKELHAYIM
jgi:hypothetical protein